MRCIITFAAIAVIAVMFNPAGVTAKALSEQLESIFEQAKKQESSFSGYVSDAEKYPSRMQEKEIRPMKPPSESEEASMQQRPVFLQEKKVRPMKPTGETEAQGLGPSDELIPTPPPSKLTII